jgi:hypothetical protein
MDDCDIFDEKEMKQRGTSVDSSSLVIFALMVEMEDVAIPA